MKALVTGAAGFIGSHLSAALAARGVDVVGLDCFTDYYARDIKEANLAALAAHAAVPVRRRRAADRRSRRAPRRRDARLSPGRAGRRAQELGRGVLGSTRRTTSMPRSGCSRRSRTGHIARFVYASSSSVYGDVAAIPMREDVGAPAASRRTASRSWRPNTCATSTTSTTACRPCRCGTSRSTARASGPTWRSTGSSAPR